MNRTGDREIRSVSGRLPGNIIRESWHKCIHALPLFDFRHIKPVFKIHSH